MVLSVFGARLVQLQGVDPDSYAAMAAAEGTVDVVLPAERGDILDRNGEPLADSVDGLMVVADPLMTADEAPEIARFLDRRLDVDYIDTLERLRDRGSRFEYIARRVPSTLANDVAHRGRGPRLRGALDRRDPVRTYPAARRGRQPGRLHRHRRGASAASSEVFDRHLSGTDGSARYEVGAGNRIPLGDNTDGPRGRRPGPAARPSTATCSGTPSGCSAQAVEDAGGDSGIAVVMDTRTGEMLAAGRLPDVRRRRPGRLPGRATARARSLNCLRARLGREGAHPLLADRRRAGHRPHQDRWCPASWPARTGSIHD